MLEIHVVGPGKLKNSSERGSQCILMFKWKKKVFQINQEVQILKIEKFNIYKKTAFSSSLKNKNKEVQIKIKGVVWCLRKTQILSISRKNKSMRFNLKNVWCLFKKIFSF